MRKHLAIEDRRSYQRLFVIRVSVLSVIALALMLGLVARMAQLQIWRHDVYRAKSDENRIQVQPLAPPRGLIYDRNGNLLADNQPVFSLALIQEQIQDMDGLIAQLAGIVHIEQAEIERFREQLRQRRRPFEPVTLKVSLTEEEIAVLAVNRHRLAGVEVAAQLIRHYPLGAFAAHPVGSVRRIAQSDLQHLDPVRYRGMQHIGKRGVEQFYEQSLHGDVGYQWVETDANGRVRQVLDISPPRAGKNIVLHLDGRLQIAAAAALGERRGAVVALDARSGGILAMVSNPGYDPNLFSSGISGAQYRALIEARERPLFDRAINGQYAPGSTFKPIVALAGLASGEVDWEEEILDQGWFRLPGQRRIYRDWSWTKNNSGGQGIVNLNRAIYRSSNVFFYHLGARLQIDQLAAFARQFGYGQATALDVAGASAGLMPDSIWKQGARGEPWYPGDTVNLSIGQGDLLATPLQVAIAASVIANRGKLMRPRMLRSSDGLLIEADPPQSAPEISGLSPEDWERMVDAMEDVVHRGNKGFRQNGTAWAYIGQDIGYRMAGKSGTAQVVEISQGEEYEEEELDEFSRKHAWFMAFAPADDPLIALSVLVENGGGGSSVAGPVARAVADAYLLPRLAEG